MPFDKSAKIELVSLRDTGPPVDVRAGVIYAPAPRAANEGEFYALWRHEDTHYFTKLKAPAMSSAIILRLLFSMKKLGPACK